MAYHHAWLQMPDRRIVDDSPQGPIGQLKDDLLHFDLNLPLITRLGWWWSDPDRQAAPPPGTWPALSRLVVQLVRALGGINELLRIFKKDRSGLVRAIARTYLARFKMDSSLIPPTDNKLKEIFTQPVSPLRPEHLTGDASAPDAPGVNKYALVDEDRTLGEYAKENIAVRVTRANYRTGRLEISAYVPLESFVRFMEKQAWRIEAFGPEKLPLGSFRLQVPGNPNAINAGLCSGRFPGVFAPFPITDIYPAKDPENTLLYRLLDGWLNDPDLAAQMKQAYLERAGEKDGKKWDNLFARWQVSESMRDFFPTTADTYVDGGTIDNTPSNSAIDYVREWVDSTNHSRREYDLDLYVIYLGTEPKVTPDKVKDPAIYEVVNRTLAIQGVAKQSSDADTVSIINTFGERSEELALVLKSLLAGYEETLATLNDDQKRQARQRLYDAIRQLDLHEAGLPGKSPEEVFEHAGQWADGMLKRLPLRVEAVKIYPEEMPLTTLQFTERLGYRKANAIKMLTMGCYNTLWALRSRLEEQPEASLDDLDRKVLALARKWMGNDPWPGKPADQQALQQSWSCQRTECVYHQQFCARGVKKA